MSTLAIVEVVLREAGTPLTVREIVGLAGARLPSRSKTPDTVVARDLSLHIKQKQDASLFVRTAPGKFTMRDLLASGGLAATPLSSSYLRDGAPAGTLPAARSAGMSTTAESGAAQASVAR